MVKCFDGQLAEKSIIFDLDGTLIDSFPAISISMDYAFAAVKCSQKKTLEESMIGPPLEDIIQNVAGIQDENLKKEIVSIFIKHYDEGGYKETKQFPGISICVKKLFENNNKLYIATNKRNEPTKKIIEMFSWQKYFTAVYTRDGRIPYYSSKADMIDQLIVDYRIEKDHALYVGDRVEDEHAANSVGIGFIKADWGYN